MPNHNSAHLLGKNTVFGLTELISAFFCRHIVSTILVIMRGQLHKVYHVRLCFLVANFIRQWTSVPVWLRSCLTNVVAEFGSQNGVVWISFFPLVLLIQWISSALLSKWAIIVPSK